MRETAGAVENLRLLQDPKSGVHIGFVTGDVPDSSHAPEVLSLGPISTVPFWVFYSSTEPIDRLSQLKGKRIAVGPIGSGTRYSAENILSKGGVNSQTATLLPFAGLDAVGALKDGKVDAACSPLPLFAIVRASELKAANEEVNASRRRDCLKLLSALVAAVRHPAAPSAP
jgi:TRAP-type uncharacterized transport system substrate-binding protein